MSECLSLAAVCSPVPLRSLGSALRPEWPCWRRCHSNKLCLVDVRFSHGSSAVHSLSSAQGRGAVRVPSPSCVRMSFLLSSPCHLPSLVLLVLPSAAPLPLVSAALISDHSLPLTHILVSPLLYLAPHNPSLPPSSGILRSILNPDVSPATTIHHSPFQCRCPSANAPPLPVFPSSSPPP